ncbi:MAG TPA: DUF429 domain-containing protein [Longimicrobium sp.]|nr:DUF429 domain-containing protein [Longimicrobium sp.]
MTDFQYFGGIDFSGAREPLSNLWAAVGREQEGKLEIVSLCPLPFREDLRAHVAGYWRKPAGAGEDDTILWGADFPFGVPASMAQRIAGLRQASWAGVAAWVADRPPEEIWKEFPDLQKTPRGTDTGGALAPLDMRIYKQTLEGMRFLHELRDAADVSILPQAPNASATTTVIEIYPSGAAKDLGIRGGRVPSRPGEVRARPAALKPFMTFAHPAMESCACTLEDARDACIAALVAFLCRSDLDQPRRQDRVPAEMVVLEGWIYRPPITL